MMNTLWIKQLLIALIIITHQGCTIFKPLEESAIPVDIPNAYTTYYNTIQPNKKETNIFWWKSFNNPELNQLIQKALNDNFDIKIAWARLAQSKANVKIFTAPMFPFFDITTMFDYQPKNSKNNETLSEKKDLNNTNIDIGLASSYEIDLWGRIKAEYKAGIYNYQSSHYDLYTSMVTITSMIADTWISIIGTQEELFVLEKQININTLLFENQLLRFNNGMASGLDVLQQQEILVSTKSEKPILEMQLQTLHNQLALLLGSYPNTLTKITTTALPKLPKMPHIGIPSDLIIQRPDIQSAWNKLSAAKWNTSAAKAQLLPTVKLSATISSKNDTNQHIFSNWITSLASSLTAPIFYGGKLAAGVEKNKEIVEEQVQIYGKTVAQAINEVENALSNEYYQNQCIHQLSHQLNYATIAWTESLNSYLGGRDSFLRYITLLQNVQSLEKRIVREKTNLLHYRIALYRALGGSWINND